MVVDNVPLSPAKLEVLADIALSSGFVDLPIVKEGKTIGMAECAPLDRIEAAMFPCMASSLEAGRPFLLLDDAPQLDKEVTLIGCHLPRGYPTPFTATMFHTSTCARRTTSDRR